ncbi:MAG: hypothetical protein H7144_00655 [Burkholderiales bacterium]|nr:hypothetical protein [Phycisphaerae bacterium]
MNRYCSILILLLAMTPVLFADETSNRILRSFDFEERQTGNSEDLPADWVKLEGSGFPHYISGKLANDAAHTGRYSFRFDLHGGSLVYRYPHGKIRVFPRANYRVSAMVKAAPLANARAQLSAYFTGPGGEPIKSSIKRSLLHAGGPEWQKLEFEIESGDDAEYIVLELGLVQPAIWHETTLGRAAIFEQDIDATAWFDDVSVSQVPKLRLFTGVPANVFRRSDPITLRVELTDRLSNDLSCALLVTDAAGKKVIQRSGALELMPADPTSDLSRQTGTIRLPDLPPGWYRVALETISQGISIGTQSLDLVHLADDAVRPETDARFGMIATDLPMQGWDDLPTLLPYLGAARVKLAVWNGQADLDAAMQPKFAALLESLRALNIHPTACLIAPPPSIAQTIGGTTWGHLLKAPPDRWQPQLAYLVSRYSGYLEHWQFGLDAEAGDFATHPVYRQSYDAINRQFQTLVSQADIAMPWPAFVESPQDLPPNISLSVPSDVQPSQIPLYVQDFQKRDPRRLSVALEPLPVDRYGREARLRDIVQRIAYTLGSGVSRIDLPLPFHTTTVAGQIVRQPDEMLMVLRTMITHLGNATYKGTIPVGEDIEAFLFDRHGEGVVLLWSKADSKSKAKPVQIVLGAEPRRVDLWGNVSAVLQPKDSSGVIEMEIGTEPSLLIGIDGNLARLRSSFAFDNPMLESSFKSHTRRLRFTNPYPVAIAGRLLLVGPPAWSLMSQVPNFSLNPGETYDAAVTIEFPYSSFAGEKPVRCEIQMQGAETRQFSVPLALKLGLGEIGMSTLALRDGRDVIVQQVVTNYSDKPVNYSSFAIFPGAARQERPITDLKPGSTTIKKYRFTNADFTKPGIKKVRSGVREIEGTRVLNDETVVK